MLSTRISESGLAVCTGNSLASLWGGRNTCGKNHCRLFPINTNLLGKPYTAPDFTAFANKSSRRKSRNNDQISVDISPPQAKISYKNKLELSPGSPLEPENNSETKTQDGNQSKEDLIAPRNSVLLACTVTSGLLFASGLLLRQASHIAFTEGWIGADNCNKVTFDIDPGKLELIIGSVLLISTCRYILLKLWPDFAASSEAANKQVLSSLQPVDYLLVAFLPGIGEELLFRGAMLPLLGLNWMSVLTTSFVFGGLHLSGGRKYSFAIWATFVGFIYGLSTIMSSSILVPMAAHSLNNLVGGILWRFENED